MSYNVKKVNQKGKKEKDPNKFHLGRNLGTYLIILASLVGLVLIILALFSTLIGSTSYLQVYNNNKVNPYQDENHVEEIKDPVFVEAKDFELFDVKLEATSIDTHDSHKATFELSVIKNDSTPQLAPIRYNSGFKVDVESSYRAYASICLAADWVGVCDYSTSYSYITKTAIESTMENTTKKTISVSLGKNDVFPMTTSNWPVPIKVQTPDAYVLIAFYEEVNGQYNLKNYVLHFTYNEFYVEGTTSPAI